MAEILYEVKDVSKSFPLGLGRRNQALFQVSFALHRGETLGVLGESGCGKSTLARVMMGVTRPDAGELLFCGKPLALRGSRQRQAFGRRAQMVFQDPYQSLNPHMTVGEILAENLEIHDAMPADSRRHRVEELLEQTGLPAAYTRRYPHELSGGQRQRLSIARAISARPELLVCDEPVSALDQSVRRQVLELLGRLKGELGLTYLFIAHDVELVQSFSDRVAVMYAGRIVELGDADEVCAGPRHPYTKLLLRSVLPRTPGKTLLEQVSQETGEVPRAQGGPGCPFAGRCLDAVERCREACPALRTVDGGRMVACHLA